MSLRLDLQLEGKTLSPGDTVRGTVTVLEGGGSRRLEVLLNYREMTNGEYEATPVSLSSGNLHTGDLTAGTSHPFEIRLPDGVLPNYKSEHGELYWEVDARSDERGRDTHERRRIEVVARRPER